MSFYEGLSCPVCAKPLLPDEDIVVCPQCGLPHHRVCWKSVGQCYEHSKHGTAQQWSRNAAPQQEVHTNTTESTNLCPKCQWNNTEYAEFCSRCGTSLSSAEWHSAANQAPPPPPVWNFDPFSTGYGNSDETIGDVKADDLTAMVGNNAYYYMTRFRRMAHGGSCGWNWCAFLFPSYWLFYRKQYALGSIYFFVMFLSGVLASLACAPVLTAETDAAMMAAMQQIPGHVLFIPCVIISLISFTLQIVLGLKGNQFYYNHCCKKIKTIREKTPDLTPAELRTYGGVSFASVILLYVIASVFDMVLTTILNSFNLF